MDYKYSIIDRLKFGDQIKDNKLSFLENGNPITIKDNNGNDYWVQIDKKNKLFWKPLDYVNRSKLSSFGINEDDFQKMKQGQTITYQDRGDIFHLNIDLNEKNGFTLKREGYLKEGQLSLIKIDLKEREQNSNLKVGEEIGEWMFINQEEDSYLNKLNRVGNRKNGDIIQIKINDLLNNANYKENSLFFIDKDEHKIFMVDSVIKGPTMYENEFTFIDIENPDITLNKYKDIETNLENIRLGNLDQCLFFNSNGQLILDTFDIYNSIENLALDNDESFELSQLNQIKLLGVKEDYYKELRKGDTIKIKIKDEIVHIKIDSKEKKGFSLKKEVVNENFELEKLKLTEPKLYKILNSYERLPFGEFSYNHLDDIKLKTSTIGYDVKFNNEADIISITKEITLQEIPSLVNDLKDYYVIYFPEKNQYEIYDQEKIKELNNTEFIVLKEGLITKEDYLKIDLNNFKEVVDHRIENNINFIKQNTVSYAHSLYFFDNKDSNIYKIEAVRNDGKMYFSDLKDPDNSFNYYEGIPFNIDNIKTGKFDHLSFYNGVGDKINNIENHFHLLRDYEVINELKTKSFENNYFQYDYERYVTKKDLDIAGGDKEMIAINRFIDYLPDTIENKDLSRYEKEELFNSLSDKGILSGASNYMFDENILKKYKFNEDKILITEVYPLERNGKTTTIGNKPIDTYKVPFESLKFTNNNQILNTMAKSEKSANDIDVKGAKTAEDKPVITYKEGDPVLVKEGNLTLLGIVKEAKEGNLTIDVRNNKEIKETTANEKDVEPLFYVNKEDQKIWLKFSYKEVTRALNNTDGIKVKLENNQVMGLMAGEKSKVMPYQVDIDGKLANVEGRVFLRRNAEGNPYVANDVKHRELNLDLPVYGVKLNDEQKQTLIQKGELGLVSGFKSGDKEFSLWVGLDKELNKVVTKRESDVYIDKVYGVQLSEMQKSELKKGNGVEIKDKNLFIKVSAAGTSSNSLGVYKTEKAIELGLMKKAEEKKNGKGTGMKM